MKDARCACLVLNKGILAIRWKKTFFWEVRCPEEEEIEFAVWDEDGESDDLVGRCMLPVSSPACLRTRDGIVWC